MKKNKLLVPIMLTIAGTITTFTACDAVGDIAGKIPSLESIIGNITGGTHEHVFNDATCTAPKTCECGATEGEALGHTYIEGKCACGEEDPNYVPPHEHNYEPTVTDPTCTEAGYTTYTCACGDTYTADEVAATGHSYENVVTAPTCTEAGYTTYTCACGDTYTADEVAANGHTHESVVTAPTCTEAGYTTYTCACGDTYTADEVAATGHTFIDSECTKCEAEYVAPATSWQLVTTLNDGDLVLIGAASYGKLLSAEKVNASSYYNKGVDYSVEDFANVTDAEIFTVTVNADNTYTFTSLTGDVIALADSYSSLNVDGKHKSWTLVDRGDGTFLMKNTGRNTYLEWYSSKNNWSTYTAGNTAEYYLSFYAQVEAAGEHIHNHISKVQAPTCEEAGYTSYTCKCGDTYKVDGEGAKGHSYTPVVTEPTCTVAGYTTYTCACGATYTADEVAALTHNYVDGICGNCGEEDPAAHKHNYEAVVTAPTCTATGYTTYTCSCGDSYVGEEEIAKLGHIDENLDVECDRAGCTSKVAPPAESTLSTYTANCLGSKLSTSSKYYVVGTIVEVIDAKNGIFLIDDGTGETFYFRLPKNAEGVAHASWSFRLTYGDKVQVYGAINKYSSSTAPNGQYWPAMQGPTVTILEAHEHKFSNPSCTESTVCGCLAIGQGPLGHIDENADDLCDRCDWNMNLKLSDIVIATDPNLANGVQTMGDDGKAAAWTWSDDSFDVIIAKGTSTVTLYTTAKAYMQLKKQNTLTVDNKNGVMIKTLTIKVTNATYLGHLEKVVKDANLTYTKDETNFTITIEWNSTEDFVVSNTTTSTIYVSGVEIIYE